jgi:hypothetical protein
MDNPKNSSIESDAGQILRIMSQLGSYSPSDFGALPVLWLLKKEFAHKLHSRLYITIEGREYYDGLCRNSNFQFSVTAFKEEALSGVVVKRSKKSGFTVTEQSSLKRAALPTPSKSHNTRTCEDDIAEVQQLQVHRKRLCREFSITDDELTLFIDQGRIRQCGDHWGLFDRKGDYWRHLCRKCFKASGGR